MIPEAGSFRIFVSAQSKVSSQPDGTVKSLAETYGTDIETMTGFLDGISGSLVEENKLEDDLTEDTPVAIQIDTEKLYRDLYSVDIKELRLKAAFIDKIELTPAGVAYIRTTKDELDALQCDSFTA